MKTMKYCYTLIAMIILLITITACSRQQLQKMDEKDTLRACNKDNDCTMVSVGCCGCSGGGGRMAINKQVEEAWQEKHTAECGDAVVCPAVISDDPTCSPSAKAECRWSRCEIDA